MVDNTYDYDATDAFLEALSAIQRAHGALRGAIEQDEAAKADIAEATRLGDRNAWQLAHQRCAATTRLLVDAFEEWYRRQGDAGIILGESLGLDVSSLRSRINGE